MTDGKLMTFDEKLAINARCRELRKAGREAEAMELAKTRPLSPSLAMAWKKWLGSDVLKQSGWNLSEAEAKFGSAWLDN
jgi:hypothetical protein